MSDPDPDVLLDIRVNSEESEGHLDDVEQLLIFLSKGRVQVFLQEGPYLDQLIEVGISDLIITCNYSLEEGLLMYLQLIDQFAVLFVQFHCKLILSLDGLVNWQDAALIEEDVSIGGVRNLGPSVFRLKTTEALPFDILFIEGGDILIVKFQPPVLLSLNQ